MMTVGDRMRIHDFLVRMRIIPELCKDSGIPGQVLNQLNYISTPTYVLMAWFLIK
jgi:hypothetical protein